MAKAICSSVPRYLVIQACLAVAVGAGIGGLMLVTNMSGMRTIVGAGSPGDVLVFFIGAITTFFPLVFATAIGLLSLEGNE